VRCGAADRVAHRAADQQIDIGASRSERVVTRQADLGTGLPVPVLADDDARIEAVVEPGVRVPYRPS
jgi:hypothetical protein